MTEQANIFGDAQPSFARFHGVEERVAVVDVGSNSIRLVVFDGCVRAPAYFFNEKAACGLGASIARTGRLDPEGRVRALATLRRFAALADRMRVAALDAVATAAVREAEDGPEFRDLVERETGLRLRVIAGEEEARLSALGVLLGAPDAEGVAADMGGASMELAQLTAGRVGARVTLRLGPQRLAGLDAAELRRRVDAEVARGAEAVDAHGRTLYVVGGAWRALAKAQILRRGYPMQVLQGYRMDLSEALDACAWVAGQTPEALREAGVSASRAATAPVAAFVLGRLVERLGPDAVAVSAFGLREGLYFERLPAEVRRRDPLIEACRTLEALQARFPGFGEELAAWVAPLVERWSEAERRLAHAACLLNDVNWRAHPDYRAVSCFETVTRANLAGIDHASRVWVGLALMWRYGGARPGGDIAAAMRLLDPAAADRAGALGRALRLGAMISASTPGALADARLSLDPQTVTLRLGPSLSALSGELVGRRLAALGQVLGRATHLIG